MLYKLYTDGSSHAVGSKPTGWAWLLVEPATETVHGANCGSEVSGTNNTAELTAAIEGLSYALTKLQKDDELVLCSDSEYVLGNAFGGYSATKNLELVERLQGLVKALFHAKIHLTGCWVKGHSGEEWNDTVDHMATKAKRELVEVLDRSDKLRNPVTIIAGSRTITDYEKVAHILNTAPWKPIEVICGMCEGVDLLGKQWAELMSIPVREFPADWSLGKKAGPLRNKRMAVEANSLILIWHGKSDGSANMLKIAQKYGLVIHEVIL